MAQCPCPISIKDPRANHNSVRIVVPCNKCPICLQNKRSDWSFRLTEELRTAKNAWFLTLTYSDENLPDAYHHGKDLQEKTYTGMPTLDKRDLTLFHKRLRKSIHKVTKGAHKALKYPQMKYYSVGEYGSQTHRPHYHGIYYNVPKEIIDQITEIWKNGETHTGTVTPASIHYVCKYVINKPEDYEDIQPPFALMSRNPALGSNYVNRNYNFHWQNLAPYVIKDGFKQKLPRYYKDKLFTESEKMKIAEINQAKQDNKWLENYDKEFEKTLPPYIENQFRIINKQSKSK